MATVGYGDLDDGRRRFETSIVREEREAIEPVSMLGGRVNEMGRDSRERSLLGIRDDGERERVDLQVRRGERKRDRFARKSLEGGRVGDWSMIRHVQGNGTGRRVQSAVAGDERELVGPVVVPEWRVEQVGSRTRKRAVTRLGGNDERKSVIEAGRSAGVVIACGMAIGAELTNKL
jgi:hypothetical protein